MKVDLPIEQWNAIDAALQRNLELITLARSSIAGVAQAQAADEARVAELAKENVDLKERQ